MARLSQLAHGQRAQILLVEGEDFIARRLSEMGLTSGVEVQITGAAPLGDPLELSLRGYRLCVRSTEAARVQVEVC